MQVYDILFKRGEHEGKGIWIQCGVLIEKDNGKKSLKLDVVPVDPNWDGWLVVSERRERGRAFEEAPPGPVDDVPF